MVAEIIEKLSFEKASKWGRFLKILLFGFLFGFIALTKQPFSLSENSQIFIVFFFLGSYMGLIFSGKYIDKISTVITTKWRKVTKTSKWWFYVFIIWFSYIPLKTVLSIIEEFSFGFVDILWIYMSYVVLIILPCIYSLTIYIPSNKYLSSERVTKEHKKVIADALTVLTPALGFPWVLALLFILPYTNLNPQPHWLNYSLLVGTYIAIFLFAIDLPYCFSVGETKKREIAKLENKRKKLLRSLEKTDYAQVKSWRAVYIQLEIARLDREKDKIDSETIHPYRIVIPVISFFVSGILGGLFLEVFLRLMSF